MPGKRLHELERAEINLGLVQGMSFRLIARALGRPASTICREVSRNGGREAYRAQAAQVEAARRQCRPKVRRLVANRALAVEVEAGLTEWWSPEQISNWLRIRFPHDRSMQVSHETIYQALYVQSRGGLRQELLKALRSGRTQRLPRGPLRGRGKRGVLQGMVLLSERPAEANDRAVPGHWEGDLLIGPRSQIGTLVERTTRFVVLLRLQNRSALEVREAIERKIAVLPRDLTRSLTWDRGREMAQHREFTMATGMPIYFCDPQSPWQRGSNENTNGLLRQYMPKGSDLSGFSQPQLDRIADQLNRSPSRNARLGDASS